MRSISASASENSSRRVDDAAADASTSAPKSPLFADFFTLSSLEPLLRSVSALVSGESPPDDEAADADAPTKINTMLQSY